MNQPSAPARPVGAILDHICETLCAIALLAMIVLTVSEVCARAIFHVSLELSDEFGGYLLVAITFLGIPIAHATNSFHHVELLQARISERSRLRWRIAFDCMALAGCLLIDWLLILFERNSYRSDDFANTLIGTPLWIPQMAMPVGATLLCLALLRSIVVRVRVLRQHS